MRILILCSCLLYASLGFALGNHPSAGACGSEKPWFAICTHSLHSLEGWHGDGCYANRADAEKEAEQHAKEHHKGNMRWTGVKKSGGGSTY